MITNEIREKFKKLYYEKFNITLSNEEATEMATDLINLMEVLLKPESKPNPIKTYPEERSQDETIRTQQFK